MEACEPGLLDVVGTGRERPAIRQARLPEPMLAVINALSFEGPSVDGLLALDRRDWPSLLSWCSERQLTLMLPHFCRDALPSEVHEKIALHREDFELRMRRIERQLRDIANTLAGRHIPFVVLKGFTHSPDLTPDPIWRAQGDIDIWCRPELAEEAYQALQTIGYRPSPAHSGRHLPPLLLPEAWKWNGNLAEIPISVELHHQLWGDASERIPITGQDEIWARREKKLFGTQSYNVLARQDLLGFAALHLFLHLIHGDLPLQRSWEIANFLHNHSNDPAFWTQWQEWHSPELRQIETAAFTIVESWFRCRTPSLLDEERERLPAGAQLWLDYFVFSPLRASLDSNKNHVWLHFAFLPSLASKCSALIACFIPFGLPTFVDSMDERNTASVLTSLLRQRTFLITRTRRHLESVLPTLRGGLKMIGHHAGFESGFGTFLLSSALFDVGEFLFFLLYNLYLLDRGFREDVLGLLTAAMTAGSLLGTPLAAAAERRVGLRGLLIVASLGGGCATVLRVVATGRPSLLLTAVLNGVFFSFWAVAFAPVVAGLTRPRNRSVAFGMVTAMGMSIGIGVGLVGVRLPEWIAHFYRFSPAGGKQAAILVGSVLVFLAAVPAIPLRIPHREPVSTNTYPRGPFVRRFTVALFLWIAATNSFNGFATAFLSLRLRLPLEKIGSVFSGGQALQVAAMFCGPLLIRRLGERRYIYLTALGTALMLLLLSVGPQPVAVTVYLSYVTLQYMNEPSLFGLLMNKVREAQRTGASSIMFLTMSVASTIAAPIAGRAIAGYGYPVCLAIAAVIATLAALLFRLLPDVKPEN